MVALRLRGSDVLQIIVFATLLSADPSLVCGAAEDGKEIYRKVLADKSILTFIELPGTITTFSKDTEYGLKGQGWGNPSTYRLDRLSAGSTSTVWERTLKYRLPDCEGEEHILALTKFRVVEVHLVEDRVKLFYEYLGAYWVEDYHREGKSLISALGASDYLFGRFPIDAAFVDMNGEYVWVAFSDSTFDAWQRIGDTVIKVASEGKANAIFRAALDLKRAEGGEVDCSRLRIKNISDFGWKGSEPAPPPFMHPGSRGPWYLRWEIIAGAVFVMILATVSGAILLLRKRASPLRP